MRSDLYNGNFNENNMDLGIIWELGGPSGVQNTSPRCGNDFHTRQTQFPKISLYMCFSFVFFLVFLGTI